MEEEVRRTGRADGSGGAGDQASVLGTSRSTGGRFSDGGGEGLYGSRLKVICGGEPRGGARCPQRAVAGAELDGRSDLARGAIKPASWGQAAPPTASFRKGSNQRLGDKPIHRGWFTASIGPGSGTGAFLLVYIGWLGARARRRGIRGGGVI